MEKDQKNDDYEHDSDDDFGNGLVGKVGHKKDDFKYGKAGFDDRGV